MKDVIEINMFTYILTIVSSIIGGFIAFLLTHLFNNIGQIKILFSDVYKTYYKRIEDGSEEIVVPEPPKSFEYDDFTCSFTIGIYNTSQQRKVIKNITYGLLDLKSITHEPIRKEPLNLLPKECKTITFIVKYNREYQNYFKTKKHYICFENSNDRIIKKRIWKIKQYTELKKEDKTKLKQEYKPFSIICITDYDKCDGSQK